ncbi:MAG TPA: aminotransferase class IV, partial [Candidatus Thermoplasmatota archaeon]|nr:aminotransferase class IV [Candidatus Thermoplasmatota archaeon]
MRKRTKAVRKARTPARAARRAPNRAKGPEGLAYVEGKVLALHLARVPLNDRGYLLGDGVFETLRTSNQHIFRLDEHAARITRGLKALGLEAELASEFRDAVQALAKPGWKAFGGELYIRINVSTGPLDDVAGNGRGITVTGLCKKFKPYPMQYYARGIHVTQSPIRKHTADPLSNVKT